MSDVRLTKSVMQVCNGHMTFWQSRTTLPNSIAQQKIRLTCMLLRTCGKVMRICWQCQSLMAFVNGSMDQGPQPQQHLRLLVRSSGCRQWELLTSTNCAKCMRPTLCTRGHCHASARSTGPTVTHGGIACASAPRLCIQNVMTASG